MNEADKTKDVEGKETNDDYFSDAELEIMIQQQAKRAKEFKMRRGTRVMEFYCVIYFILPIVVFIIILLIILVRF